MNLKSLVVLFTIICCSSYSPRIGEVIDIYQGVKVYYNSQNFSNVAGRNVTSDGYNVGLKYQCVEFVKRFYLEYFDHRMPDPSGHAKDFFDDNLADAAFNKKRGLMQYRNVRREKPKVNDLLIYGSRPGNPFGHVAIITKVTQDQVEYIQQNFGIKTRQNLKLVNFQGIYTIADYDIKGWLRKI